MNQKEAVFLAIKEIRRGAVDTDQPVVLTKQEKSLVHQKLFDGFKKGKVAYNHDMPSDDKLLLYVSGLVSNWLRKDKRLNGQRNYVPRRPGSRTPSPVALAGNANSEQIAALRQLAGIGADDAEVQVFVVRRPSQSVAQPGQEASDQE